MDKETTKAMHEFDNNLDKDFRVWHVFKCRKCGHIHKELASPRISKNETMRIMWCPHCKERTPHDRMPDESPVFR